MDGKTCTRWLALTVMIAAPMTTSAAPGTRGSRTPPPPKPTPATTTTTGTPVAKPTATPATPPTAPGATPPSPADAARIPPGMAPLTAPDLLALAHVHQNDRLEVQAGRLAIERGASQAVRTFGQQLVDDHGADARLIVVLAHQQKAVLPDGKPLGEAAQLDLRLARETAARLASLSGPMFDREFLRAQIALHDEALASLDRDLATLHDNPDLVQLLGRTRQTIVEHGQEARLLLGTEHARATGR